MFLLSPNFAFEPDFSKLGCANLEHYCAHLGESKRRRRRKVKLGISLVEVIIFKGTKDICQCQGSQEAELGGLLLLQRRRSAGVGLRCVMKLLSTAVRGKV